MEPDSNHTFTSKLPHKQSRCNRQLWLNPTDINYVLTRHLPRSSSVSAQTCQTFTFFLKYSSSSWLPESRLLFALFAFAAAPLVIKHPRVSNKKPSRRNKTRRNRKGKERGACVNPLCRHSQTTKISLLHTDCLFDSLTNKQKKILFIWMTRFSETGPTVPAVIYKYITVSSLNVSSVVTVVQLFIWLHHLRVCMFGAVVMFHRVVYSLVVEQRHRTETWTGIKRF